MATATNVQPESSPARRLWRQALATVRRLPPVAIDGAAGLLMWVLSLLPLGVEGVGLGGLHGQAVWWLPPFLAAGQTLPLFLRRIHPAVVLGVVGVAFATTQLAGVTSGVAGLGLFVAIYSFAAYGRHYRALVAVGATASYIALALALHAAGSPELLIDWVTFALVLLLPWLAGQLVRRRIAELASRVADAAAAAVRNSRNALARDLHDIVTHHVTAIVVQADSATYLGPDQAGESARTLEIIAATGRRTLHELRSLLGALEQTPPGQASLQTAQMARTWESGPFPGSVADLVEEAQATGYPVTLGQQSPLPATSEAVSVTLYRIAQEALTNAMKHSPNAAVKMTLTGSERRIELRVTNEISGDVSSGPGRGLRGMADRTSLLGGTFASGVVHGCFEVRVTLDAVAELAP